MLKTGDKLSKCPNTVGVSRTVGPHIGQGLGRKSHSLEAEDTGSKAGWGLSVLTHGGANSAPILTFNVIPRLLSCTGLGQNHPLLHEELLNRTGVCNLQTINRSFLLPLQLRVVKLSCRKTDGEAQNLVKSGHTTHIVAESRPKKMPIFFFLMLWNASPRDPRDGLSGQFPDKVAQEN